MLESSPGPINMDAATSASSSWPPPVLFDQAGMQTPGRGRPRKVAETPQTPIRIGEKKMSVKVEETPRGRGRPKKSVKMEDTPMVKDGDRKSVKEVKKTVTKKEEEAMMMTPVTRKH